MWTDRERDWEEAEPLDTGQERPCVLDGHWLCQGQGAGHGAWQRSIFLLHHLSSHPMVSPVIWLFVVVLVFSVARLKWMHDDGIVNCCVEGRVQPICDQ